MPPSQYQEQSMSTTLRQSTILTFFPSLFILIIHGVVSTCPVPALGLIPLALSALLGGRLLYRDYLSPAGSQIIITITLTPASVLFADIALALFHFIILLITWIVMSENRWVDAPQVMLGTYGTIPMMWNCAVHAYFAFSQIERALGHSNEMESLHAESQPMSEGETDGGYTDVEAGGRL